MKIRIMLDTNVYDKILYDENLNGLLSWGRQNNLIELIATHIQRDQLMAMKNQQKKKEALKVISMSAVPVSTAGIFFDVSKFDQAEFANKSNHLEIDKFLGIKSKNGKNLSDAIISITSKYKADILITEDGQMMKSAKKIKINTMDVDQLKKFLWGLKAG